MAHLPKNGSLAKTYLQGGLADLICDVFIVSLKQHLTDELSLFKY